LFSLSRSLSFSRASSRVVAQVHQTLRGGTWFGLEFPCHAALADPLSRTVQWKRRGGWHGSGGGGGDGGGAEDCGEWFGGLPRVVCRLDARPRDHVPRRLLGLRREVAPVQAAARRRWRRTRRAGRPPPPLAPAASLRPHHHAHAGVRPSDSPRSVLASRPPLCPSTRRLSARRAPHAVYFFGG
jgi:hypothetical protein